MCVIIVSVYVCVKLITHLDYSFNHVNSSLLIINLGLRKIASERKIVSESGRKESRGGAVA